MFLSKSSNGLSVAYYHADRGEDRAVDERQNDRSQGGLVGAVFADKAVNIASAHVHDTAEAIMSAVKQDQAKDASQA